MVIEWIYIYRWVWNDCQRKEQESVKSLTGGIQCVSRGKTGYNLTYA